MISAHAISFIYCAALASVALAYSGHRALASKQSSSESVVPLTFNTEG